MFKWALTIGFSSQHIWMWWAGKESQNKMVGLLTGRACSTLRRVDNALIIRGKNIENINQKCYFWGIKAIFSKISDEK